MSNKRGGGGQQGGTQGGGGHRGGSQPKYSPNDDRGIVNNDNNPASDADKANREKQAERGW